MIMSQTTNDNNFSLSPFDKQLVYIDQPTFEAQKRIFKSIVTYPKLHDLNTKSIRTIVVKKIMISQM
jgi:hypothetical protein